MAFNKKNALTLGIKAALRQGYTDGTSNFSCENVNDAFRDQVKELVGDYSLFRRNKLDFYELIEEIYAEVLPQKVLQNYGVLAEVQTVGHGQKITFKKKLGRARGKSFVTRVGLGGVFETFRLDSTEFTIETEAIGGATAIDFERFLAGQEDLAEQVDILMEGIDEEIYVMLAKAINNSAKSVGVQSTDGSTFAKYDAKGELVPNRDMTNGNKTFVEASKFDQVSFDQLINTVRYYGNPIIVCTHEFADKIPCNYLAVSDTATGAKGLRISEQDVADMRTYGVLKMYKGCPIVVLPQSFEDETNQRVVMNPAYCYIIPGDGNKLARIVFEGGPVANTYEQKDRSMEFSMYQKVGIAILHYNNWGLYHDSELDTDSVV